MLDRKREFGTVYGEGPVRYEQDGKKFDGHGNEIKEAPAAPAADKKPADTKADAVKPAAKGKAAEPAAPAPAAAKPEAPATDGGASDTAAE